ncbi:PE family protein, partial [Mycobacterium helveticum]
MSFVMTVPEVLGTAAGSLAGIGSSIDTANAAAAAQTTGLLPAARGLGGHRGAVLQPWTGVSVAQRAGG